MSNFKDELKKQILVEIKLDEIIQKYLDRQFEEHQSDIENECTFSEWFPLNDVKKDIKKEIVNVIQFDKTKPKGSNPNKIIRNKRICKEYDKFTNKGRKQIEAERLLSKKYDLSPQTIRKIVKDPNNTL